jgi:hypothetical protein
MPSGCTAIALSSHVPWKAFAITGLPFTAALLPMGVTAFFSHAMKWMAGVSAVIGLCKFRGLKRSQ